VSSSAVVWNSLSLALRITSLIVAAATKHLDLTRFSVLTSASETSVLCYTNTHFNTHAGRSQYEGSVISCICDSVCVWLHSKRKKGCTMNNKVGRLIGHGRLIAHHALTLRFKGHQGLVLLAL